MRRFVLIALPFFCFYTCAVGVESEFASWMRGRNTPTSAIQDTDYCVSVCKASLSDLALVSVAPDGQRYAVLICSPASQVVKIQSLRGGKTIMVYEGRTEKHNHFAPLGLLWNPDSDRLFVKFGYKDIGNGFWFPHDAGSGDMIGGHALFKRVASTPIAQRTDALSQDGPQPVWTIGGKQFENEHAARSAGHVTFFSSRDFRGSHEYVAHVEWATGKRYSVFIDPRDRYWLAHVIVDEKIIDSIQVVAPMYQRVLFMNDEERLVAKVLPRDGQTNRRLTIDFGMREIERVTDLGRAGLLVQSTDAAYRYWQILNPVSVGPSQQ